jgi:pimeloyl-ACP methyl ester carboxylesterase
MWDTFENWQTVVRALRVPTLLLTAIHKRGAIVTQAVARQAEILSPYIRVANIRGAGHSIRRDNYTAFLRQVRLFLGSLR